jgi:hypothetical protein
MLSSRNQNAGQNRNIKIANRSFLICHVQMFADDSNNSKFDSGGN